MKRRVLIIAHGHPEEMPTGGERAAYALFEALRGHGEFEAHFAAPRQAPRLRAAGLRPWGGRADEWELPGGETDRFLLSQRDPDALAAHREVFERLRPDVVHFHHYFRSGMEAIALARRVLPQARILLTLHEFLAICFNNGQMVRTGSFALCERASPKDCSACFPDRGPDDFALRRRFLLANLGKVDHFVSPSEFLRRRYIEWGVPEARISTIENVLPPLPRIPPRALPEGGRRAAFGYFGSISTYKGIRLLVEAFEDLAARPGQEDVTLTLHGLQTFLSPEAEAWFAAALKRLAPRLRWTGRYGPADLPRLMAAIDWVVVPSVWWENSPLVIQEALMMGRPLIVSDIGGMAEKVREGIDGFTFPAGDAGALAETMGFAIPRYDAMRVRDVVQEGRSRFDAILGLYRATQGAVPDTATGCMAR